jgi:hypothetical protein
MKSANRSTKRMILVGLFLFAIVWVGLMGVVGYAGGARSYSAGESSLPFADDGSVRAKITNVDRDGFHITLSLDVTNKDGKLLPNLSDQEFEVREDGELVALKKFTPAGQSGVQVALVLDDAFTSGPAAGVGQRELIKVGGLGLLKALRDHSDSFGLYLNNNHALDQGYREAVAVGPLDPARREKARSHIVGTPAHSSSDSQFLSTMGLALSKLDELRGRRILIALTIGHDSMQSRVDSAGRPQHEAVIADLVHAAKKSNIPLFMVYPAGGEEVTESTMKRLAGETGGEYYVAATATRLTEYLIHVGESLRNEYTLEYDSPNPVEDGLTRKVEVVVRSGSVGTRAKADYHVPGVLATGAGKRQAGAADRPSVPTFTVFLPLFSLIAVLFGVPYLFWPRSRTDQEPESVSPPAAHVGVSPVLKAQMTPPGGATKPVAVRPALKRPDNSTPAKARPLAQRSGPSAKLW